MLFASWKKFSPVNCIKRILLLMYQQFISYQQRFKLHNEFSIDKNFNSCSMLGEKKTYYYVKKRKTTLRYYLCYTILLIYHHLLNRSHTTELWSNTSSNRSNRNKKRIFGNFQRFQVIRSQKYTKYIADGEAKTLSAFFKSKPYGDWVLLKKI